MHCQGCNTPLATGTYCCRCLDDQGVLIPFPALLKELTVELMVQNEGMSRAEARDHAKCQLAKAAAWADHPALDDQRTPPRS